MTVLKRLQGLYLVVDPSIPHDKLLDIVQKAIVGGVDVLQLWSSDQKGSEILRAAEALAKLAEQYEVPFLVNNDVTLAKHIGADGVHFDGYDITPAQVRAQMGKKSLVGYTLGSNLDKLKWANSA